MANPPIDDVFKQCFDAMDKGADLLGKKVKDKGHGILKARYFKSFLAQLESSETAWKDSEEMVIHAATHIGQLAAALAGFDKKSEVDWMHAEKAGQIMEGECRIKFGIRGQWCEPAKSPQPQPPGQ